MDNRKTKAVDCDRFREDLFLYQSEELSSEDRSAMQEHLDRCAGCADRLELENRLLAALKAGLPREKAPESLGLRVRAALEQEASIPPVPERRTASFAGWWRDPKWATLAALLLLVLLVAPFVRRGGGERGAGGSPVPAMAVYTGVIVDSTCDKAGLSILQQMDCPDHTHLNALKLTDGRYLYFNLYQSRYTRFVTDPRMRGREITVQAAVYPDIQTLEIVNLQEVAGKL